jgi:RNA polymerase subunit RPABC4/transcription elongation factor Spt4
MTVTPVEARCTRCRSDFALAELLHRRDGSCPRCGRQLTDDWVSVLLDEARRVDIAQKHLASSLRRLRELPGHLVLLPHPVIRNMADALDWEKPADDDGALDDQRKLLTELAAQWTDHTDGRRRGSPWLRRRAVSAPA